MQERKKKFIKKIKREIETLTGQTRSMGEYKKQKDIKLVKQWSVIDCLELTRGFQPWLN